MIYNKNILVLLKFRHDFVTITRFFSPEFIRLFLYLFGTIGITSAYTVLYITTCEMFPTPLRSSLLAFVSMLGRIGQVIAPQVSLLVSNTCLMKN